MTVIAKLDDLAARSEWNFSDLRALFINCTLKKSPEVSNTEGLADLAISVMERNGVSVDVVRAVDYEIADGCVSRHDGTRMGSRRLAPDSPAGDGR